MIVKEFEFNKININNYNLYLLHGKNEGLKKETISKIISKNENIEIQKLDEKQILENQELFMDEILSSSLFSNKKLIIINRATDKILKNIENIFDKKINGLILIINSDPFEKKSKLRSFFEYEIQNTNILYFNFLTKFSRCYQFISSPHLLFGP